jgi:hypothetical protein
MQNKIELIIFTPKENTAQGRALKTLIQGIGAQQGLLLNVTTWDEGEHFFGHENRFPMNECIRKLHSFDGAVLILGAGAPRRSASTLRNIGNAAAWRLRRLFGVPEPVNSNVLIEVGASMARFGRNRVFLVEPQSGAVEVPSYFRQNNALFTSYNDRERDPEAAMAGAASEIVSKLKSLGQAAYYSDLPSFGLAHGYLNALIRPAIENVESGAEVTIGGQTRTFNRTVFIIAYATSDVASRGAANETYKRLGLAEALVKAKDGRAISVRTLPDGASRETLFIVDIPTNLVPSVYAITKIEELWIGGDAPGTSYSDKLEEREIANFFRYLDLLRGENGIAEDKVRFLAVETLDVLTLEALRALF